MKTEREGCHYRRGEGVEPQTGTTLIKEADRKCWCRVSSVPVVVGDYVHVALWPMLSRSWAALEGAKTEAPGRKQIRQGMLLKP